jgi:hypothetical protein
MRRLKQDASLALELRRSAVQDLEGLRDELKRQELLETLRLRELRSRMSGGVSAPYDYLV